MKFSNGNYPARLADLRGGKTDLESPEPEYSEDLIDGFGNPFHYAVVVDALGRSEVFIWAERISDGKMTIYGAKLTWQGAAIKLGLPDD